LTRDEKRKDQFIAEFDALPDGSAWHNPIEIYNKLRFGRRPECGPEEEEDPPRDVQEEAQAEEFPTRGDAEAQDETWTGEDDPAESEGYPEIARLAHDFAVRVLQTPDIPEDAQVLYLSAGKVGAHLAGGHGLGYDEDTLCGNIVKCRWALADCRFCCEMLELLHRTTGNPDFAAMLEEASALSEALAKRIERLRARVWW
jgi:hypothetical protein